MVPDVMDVIIVIINIIIIASIFTFGKMIIIIYCECQANSCKSL